MVENSRKKQPIKRKQTSAQKERKGSGFWIGLICFTSLWMFILGILVGRGTAPVQFDVQKLEKELIALKEVVLKKEKERMEDYADTTKGTTELDFYEDLKQPTEEDNPTPVIVEKSLAEQSEENTTETKTSLAKKTKKEYRLNDAVIKEAPESALEPGPATKPLYDIKPPQPSSDAAEPSGYPYTIQVSSLKDPKAADKIVESLKQKGYKAYRMTANVGEKGIWYRVRVGPFRDKASAEIQLSRLKENDFNAILISL